MKCFLILLLIVSSNLIYGQSRETELTHILDTVISRSKEISFYSKTVDWASLSTKIRQSAKNAKNLTELKPAFEILLNELRDHHGAIRKLSDYSIIANFTDHPNKRKTDHREFDPEIWKVVNDVTSRFEYTILPNSIGYLKVVGVGPNVDGQKEAERIRSVIDDLFKNKVDKWIVDLRYNGGGNVNVMMAGLAPLFDAHTVVNIQDEDENIQGTAEIKDGNFWYFGVNAFEIKNKPKITNPKIAILTSRWTVSSGEFVAVAFKGQKNTKFFGEKTGGFTTNNSWEVINNEIALVISTGVYSDRNGNKYDQNVEPDIEIVFEVEDFKEKDIGIIEAVNWLISK